MAASEKLEAARRSGSLTDVMSVLRDEARAEPANASTPVREQLGLEDAAVRVSASLAGKSDVERRAALREVRPGTTVSATGVVARTKPTYAQQLTRALDWAGTLTASQRHAYITGEKFEALPDHTQGLIVEAFAKVDDDELVLENTVGEPSDIAAHDLNGELPYVDALVGDEDDDEGEVADDDYEALFEQTSWEQP